MTVPGRVPSPVGNVLFITYNYVVLSLRISRARSRPRVVRSVLDHDRCLSVAITRRLPMRSPCARPSRCRLAVSRILRTSRGQAAPAPDTVCIVPRLFGALGALFRVRGRPRTSCRRPLRSGRTRTSRSPACGRGVRAPRAGIRRSSAARASVRGGRTAGRAPDSPSRCAAAASGRRRPPGISRTTRRPALRFCSRGRAPPSPALAARRVAPPPSAACGRRSPRAAGGSAACSGS